MEHQLARLGKCRQRGDGQILAVPVNSDVPEQKSSPTVNAHISTKVFV